MTPELFPPSTVSVESPRLRWMKEHGVKVRNNIVGFVASKSEMQHVHYPHLCGFGTTADDAIADWARKNGVRLWSEQGL